MYCHQKRPGIDPTVSLLCCSLVSVRLGVVILKQSVLIDIAFVTGLICAVAYNSVLIRDEEQVIVVLIVEGSVYSASYNLTDRSRRETGVLTRVVRISAFKLTYLEVDSVFLEYIADSNVRSERHALVESVHEYARYACLVISCRLLGDY